MILYSLPEKEDDLPPLEIEVDSPIAKSLDQKLDGCRIVNIKYFTDQCKQLAVHDVKCTMGKMHFKSEPKTGPVSCFSYFCDTCEKTMKIYSHPPDTTKEVNKMLVWGSNSIGIGYSQAQEIFSCLDLPIMSSTYFQKVEKTVGDDWQEILQKQMLEAGQAEKSLALEAEEVENGVPYITVIIDGGWAKRSYGHGFSSLSGVAVIIGKRTGKLLFLGVRNKYCSVCSSARAKDSDKPHICYKNYNGTSTGMEQDIIIEGFNRSIEDHGVQYKYVVGDGDSSVYARIIERVTYGRFVEKLV